MRFRIGSLIVVLTMLAAGCAPVCYKAANVPYEASVVHFEDVQNDSPYPANQPPEPIDFQAAANPLSLAELEELALQDNPTLLAAEAAVRAARGRLVQAGLYPNPVLSYQSTEIGQEAHAGQHGAFASQQIIKGGKIQWRQAVAHAEIAQAQHEFDAQLHRIITDVRLTFYDAISANMMIATLQKLVKSSDEAIIAADTNVKAGGSRADLLLAKATAGRAKAQLAAKQSEYNGALRRLAVLVRDDRIATAKLVGELDSDLPEFDWDEQLARLEQESPEVAAAAYRIQQAQHNLALACANSIPNVTVQVGAQFDDATNFTFAGLQLSSPIPIHNFNQGNIQQARAQLVGAEAELQRLRNGLRQRLAEAFQRWQSARQQHELLRRDVIRNATDALDLLLVHYRNGDANYEKLFSGQQTLYQASLARTAALRELRASEALIEGYLLRDSLRVAAGGRAN